MLCTGAFSLCRGSEAGIVNGHGFGASFARNLYPSARHPFDNKALMLRIGAFVVSCLKREPFKELVVYMPGTAMRQILNVRSLYLCVNLAGLGRTEASE